MVCSKRTSFPFGSVSGIFRLIPGKGGKVKPQKNKVFWVLQLCGKLACFVLGFSIFNLDIKRAMLLKMVGLNFPCCSSSKWTRPFHLGT